MNKKQKERDYVSIILPTYERPHEIKKAIKSVLLQTYKYFELIIIDDSKTEKTKNVVLSFNDPRIRYIHTSIGKRGVSAARNYGIKLSRYSLISFIDDDDVWMKNKLEKQIDVFKEFKNPNIIIASQYIYKYRNGSRKVFPQIKSGWVFDKEILYTNYIGMSTVLLSKKIFRKIGFFDEKLKRFNDWEMWIRASLSGIRFYVISQPLCIIKETKKSISSDEKFLIKGYEYLFKKYHKEFIKNKKAYSKHLSIYSSALLKNNEIKKSLKYLLKSVLYSLDIRNILRFFYLSLIGRS